MMPIEDPRRKRTKRSKNVPIKHRESGLSRKAALAALMRKDGLLAKILRQQKPEELGSVTEDRRQVGRKTLEPQQRRKLLISQIRIKNPMMAATLSSRLVPLENIVSAHRKLFGGRKEGVGLSSLEGRERELAARAALDAAEAQGRKRSDALAELLLKNTGLRINNLDVGGSVISHAAQKFAAKMKAAEISRKDADKRMIAAGFPRLTRRKALEGY